jgi:hypothetical protein
LEIDAGRADVEGFSVAALAGLFMADEDVK